MEPLVLCDNTNKTNIAFQNADDSFDFELGRITIDMDTFCGSLIYIEVDDLSILFTYSTNLIATIASKTRIGNLGMPLRHLTYKGA